MTSRVSSRARTTISSSAIAAAFAFCTSSCSSTEGAAAPATPGPTSASPANDAGGAPAAPTSTSNTEAGSPACESPAHVTAASHIKLTVTWDGTTLLQAGSGTADLWLLATYDRSGDAITGTVKTCGITVPAVTSSALAGSKKVQLVFQDNWDKPSMPTFPMKGTQAGWNTGDAFSFDPSTGALGLSATSSYANPATAWPASGTFPVFAPSDLADPDGVDGPGITMVAISSNGFSLLPTSADIITSPTADRASAVARNTMSLTGKATSCGEFSGSATVSLFENHIVGCHDASGSNCANTTSGTSSGPGFLDANRTLFKPGAATFVAKRIADGSTCAQARAALP